MRVRDFKHNTETQFYLLIIDYTKNRLHAKKKILSLDFTPTLVVGSLSGSLYTFPTILQIPHTIITELPT